jgi:hypothetical protein
MSVALAISPSPSAAVASAPDTRAAHKAHVVAALRQHLAEVAPLRPLPVGLPTGIPALEAAFGGWPSPGVALIQGPLGSGRFAPVLPLLARLTRSGRRIAIVDSAGLVHPPGLRGVLLDNVLLVRPGVTRVLWATEQLARCEVLPVTVVVDPPGFSRSATRIQRAAEAGQNTVIVLSEVHQRRLPVDIHLSTGRPGHVQLLRGGRGRASPRWLPLSTTTAPPLLEQRAFPF